LFRFEKEQKTCDIGGVRFGGQPGEYATVVCSSIFQKGDRIFSGKRSRGFNEKKASQLIRNQDKISAETGVPGMADIVANNGIEFKQFIDFLISVTDMPFCIDAWMLQPKLEAAAYCAEKGLLDRMFYNSLTVWGKDIESEIREISQIGVKHVLLVVFDQQDQMPSGRMKGTQRLLDTVEKVGAKFENIFVDTSVMNGPATAFCGFANRLIKEKWGLPTASAPSNGSYMWTRARELWGFEGWSAADAALGALSSFLHHDMIFSGPMAGSGRIFPAVAMADAFLATSVFAESKQLPKASSHPLYRLFPEFADNLKSLQSSETC
jgi:tetrahydromethanopterin S-methyltransferase subunit H